MKICLINHSFPPQIGGGETHLYLLARGFARRGHDVTVITGKNKKFLVSKDREKFSVSRVKNFKDFEKGRISIRFFLEDFKKAFLKKEFDVIHIHNFMPALAYALVAPAIKTKKVVFTFHSTPIPSERKIIGHFSDYSLEKAFASFVIKLPFYDKLVCPSLYYYNWALRLGADRKKTKLIYHGVDEKDFLPRKDLLWRKEYGYDKDDFIVVCPARMIYRKGIMDVVKAINIIKSNKTKLLILTSVINGSTEYLDKMTRFINRNKLTERVKIVIDKENIKTMPRILVNCDVCVLPSHIEGLGIVLLEGMASGIPVIGSDTFGINEVIKDKINGLLFKPKDIGDLVKKIMCVQKDKKLSATIVEGGRQSIRSEFSLEQQLKKLELIYK